MPYSVCVSIAVCAKIRGRVHCGLWFMDGTASSSAMKQLLGLQLSCLLIVLAANLAPIGHGGKFAQRPELSQAPPRNKSRLTPPWVPYTADL